jgi:hypothetical protein
MSDAASADLPMLPIIATAPAAANDRRDKWLDLLSFGIAVLPALSVIYQRSCLSEAGKS